MPQGIQSSLFAATRDSAVDGFKSSLNDLCPGMAQYQGTAGEHGTQLAVWTRALVGRETGDAGKTLRTRDVSHLRVRTLRSALGRAAAAVSLQRLGNPPEAALDGRRQGKLGKAGERLTRCA
ncbi:hypothetical protein NDU88_000384 [Pleurodeles waltl]|uniref:Uncharacterized protein n=1 Tax=Pleurodeles waltl TaxID=8319 RepID=A0AAV7VTC1_PLEWA|nr:hypothetical protein NDU88_000384 [Pleurodeles waltl]